MKRKDTSLPESVNPRLSRRIQVVATTAVVFYPAIIAFGAQLAPPATVTDWVVRCMVALWAFHPVPALFLTSSHRFRMPPAISYAIAYGPFVGVAWLYVLRWLTDTYSLYQAVALIATFILVLGFLHYFRRFRSRLLCNEAFVTVEAANRAYTPEQASLLLKEALALLAAAIRINPSNAAAFNEKGYVLSLLGNCFEAEQAHVQAIELDPEKAKYRSNLFHVWVNQICRCASQRDARATGTERLAALDAQMQEFPRYPTLYINKAVLIAVSGGNENEWEEQLTIAGRIYMEEGLPTEMILLGRSADDVILNARGECVAGAEWFKGLRAG